MKNKHGGFATQFKDTCGFSWDYQRMKKRDQLILFVLLVMFLTGLFTYLAIEMKKFLPEDWPGWVPGGDTMPPPDITTITIATNTTVIPNTTIATTFATTTILPNTTTSMTTTTTTITTEPTTVTTITPAPTPYSCGNHSVFLNYVDDESVSCDSTQVDRVYLPTNSCTDFIVCIHSRAVRYQCPCGNVFHFGSQQCLPHLSWFYTDPHDCTRYWRCEANGDFVAWHHFVCQSELAFNIFVPGPSPRCEAQVNVHECLWTQINYGISLPPEASTSPQPWTSTSPPAANVTRETVPGNSTSWTSTTSANRTVGTTTMLPNPNATPASSTVSIVTDSPIVTEYPANNSTAPYQPTLSPQTTPQLLPNATKAPNETTTQTFTRGNVATTVEGSTEAGSTTTTALPTTTPDCADPEFLGFLDANETNCPSTVDSAVSFPSNSCTTFTVCAPSGPAALYRCPCDYLFHFATHECVPHLSWFYADPGDCSMYWRCVDNSGHVSWHHFTCQPGLGFNMRVPGPSPRCERKEDVIDCSLPSRGSTGGGDGGDGEETSSQSSSKRRKKRWLIADL